MENKEFDLFIEEKLARMQLADIRKSKMSQKELSERSGLSINCISNIESGESSPTLRSVMKYVSALGLNIYIKTGEEN